MPYEPVATGLKFQIRVRDLTARDVVVVTCPACHWKCNVAPHVFYERFNEMQRMIRVAEQMKCRRCGNRKDMAWRIERAVGPMGPRSA